MVELSLASSMDGDSRNDEDYKGGLDSTDTPALPSTVEVAKTRDLEGDSLSWVVPPPSPTYTRTINRQNGTIRRVSSFPLLQSSDMPISEKPPPEYHLIPRREEEGKEALPAYSNDIILAGLLSRKMEFDRPGLQARDRSWKKVWCVLHGTMFRIYKVGTLEVKFGALAAAPAVPPTSTTTILSGGKARGHGASFSVSNIARSIVTAPIGASGGDMRPRSPTLPHAPIRASVVSDASPWKAPLNDTSKKPDSILRKDQAPSAGLSSPASSIPSGNARNSTSGSSYVPSRSSFSHSRPSTPQTRPGGGLTTSSHSSGAQSTKPMGHGPGGRSLIDNGGLGIYTPAESNLIRKYSLQNAESGLATDYLKRRNVIRVRLEGEQFLLQLPSVEEVVEWIEVSKLRRIGDLTDFVLAVGTTSSCQHRPGLGCPPNAQGSIISSVIILNCAVGCYSFLSLVVAEEDEIPELLASLPPRLQDRTMQIVQAMRQKPLDLPHRVPCKHRCPPNNTQYPQSVPLLAPSASLIALHMKSATTLACVFKSHTNCVIITF